MNMEQKIITLPAPRKRRIRGKNSGSPLVGAWTDRKGRHLLRVALANGRGTAVLLRSDWERLTAAGASEKWCLNAGARPFAYVRTVFAGKNTVVARLIAGAGRGQSVHYADRNPLNLLPENLIVSRGPSKTDHAALMQIPEPTDGSEESAEKI